MRTGFSILVPLLCLGAHSVHGYVCTQSCSNEFVNQCVTFENQGYEACRDQLDDNVPMLANQGCLPNCENTPEMEATKDNNGDDETSCSSGSIFVANSPGNPTLLCSAQTCSSSLFSSRGTEACKILIDVPTLCSGSAGKKCPIIFFFHGAGGTNANWAEELKDVIHSGTKDFIGIYPEGVDNQWMTGPQPGEISNFDDVAFVKSIMADVLSTYYQWDSRFYAYGHSNGAAMTHHLAVNGAGPSGIAPSASQLIESPKINTLPDGSLYLQTTLPSPLATSAIPIVSFHGDSDDVIPYEGGPLFTWGYTLYPTSTSLDLYAQLNGCSSGVAPTTTSVPAAMDSGITTATKMVYDTCDVTHYKVIGGRHGVANTIDGDAPTKIAVDFFAELEKRGDGDGGDLKEDNVDADGGAVIGSPGVTVLLTVIALIFTT